MTRDELLEACFGRSDLPAASRTVELTEGRDVVAHVDVYLRRVLVRHAGSLAVEGQGVEASTTVTVAQLANLCTDPSRRGSGLAGAMVKRAHLELAENRPLSFAAVLAGDERLRDFFSRFGYRHPEGAPDDLMVAALRDERWPDGARLRLLGEWG